MAFHIMIGRGASGGVCAVGVALAATASFAATPLDFPSPLDIADGRTYAWQWGSSLLMDDPSVRPFEFTYAIGAGFMNNQDLITPGQARAVIENALESWTVASRSQFMFQKSPWSAVMNDGGAPPDQWEGPSIEEWLSGEFPDVYPGWGANFEFFSVPTGFTIDSQGVHYVMKPTSLAFTVVNRVGSTHIVSVDIYFNSSFNWFDAHNDAGSGNGGGGELEGGAQYDLSTVLLHELGHALGLDHPNEATENGSVNLSPYTFDSGYQWSSEELMYGYYQGVRNHPTIDEVGGVAFLYGLPSPLDVNHDNEISGGDLAELLANWGGDELGRPGDLNYDGVIDAADLSLLLANFGLTLGAPGMDVVAPPEVDGSTTEVVMPIVRDCYHVPPHDAGTTE